MRKILFLALVLLAGTVEAQVQGEAMSVGSNLTGLACRVNEGQTALATESEANFCTTDTKGNLQVSLQAGTASATNPIKLEDSASATGDALMAIASTRNDALSVTAGTDRDYQELKSDTVGRLITTLAPAGEMGTACSAEATGTADTPIVGALASNRFYVHAISCSNNSAVPSRIVFKNGVTANFYGSIPALASGGTYTMPLPVPIRTGVNTAFQFAMTTTATATICCATGYYSVF